VKPSNSFLRRERQAKGKGGRLTQPPLQKAKTTVADRRYRGFCYEQVTFTLR